MPGHQQIILPKPLAWDQHFPDVEYAAQVQHTAVCSTSPRSNALLPAAPSSL